MTGKFTAPTVCPRCSGTMEEGLRFDSKLGELSDEYVIEDKEWCANAGKRRKPQRVNSLGANIQANAASVRVWRSYRIAVLIAAIWNPMLPRHKRRIHFR